jgi:hypothetical protein
LFRVWSTDFFLDSEASIENLHTRLTALLEEDRVAETEAANARATADELEPLTDETMGTGIESNVGDKEDHREENASRDMDESASDITEQDNTNDETTQLTMFPLRPARVARGDFLVSSEADDLTPGPNRFYDTEYQHNLQAMAAMIIDREGPITFKRLTDQLARAHGFRRTGRQISQTIWTACEQIRLKSKSADGHHICWPKGSAQQNIVPFRGMQVGGAQREWRDVPYPEKLGLIREVLSTSPSDPARSVGDAIGISRLTAPFRNEIANLISVVSQL